MRLNPQFEPEKDDPNTIEFGTVSTSSFKEALEALDDDSKGQVQEIAMNLASTLFSRESEISSAIPPELVDQLDLDRESTTRIAMIELMAFQQWQLSNLSRTLQFLLEQNQ
jgi:hypothetical protein